ncbi:2-dehydropantoate 2-reductase (Ketopantoate reductase) (KPA reductase) (KPR) [Gonapodya sp. JEL0774]|nr:2-dehydropantoate 2-reductase (Ketopantoate reductase) (KPA reductase) (KPR) [Gonapodya sp. JEL0774]
MDKFQLLENTLTLSLPDSSPNDSSRRVIIPSETPTSSREPISRLLLATKASDTAVALLSVRHRLAPGAAVVLLQNGALAVKEECEEALRRDTAAVAREGGQGQSHRPVLAAGIIHHGVYRKSDFHFVHAGGVAENWIGEIADGGSSNTSSSAPQPAISDLLADLQRAPELKVRTESPEKLRARALAKLAANASLNTLTALLRVRNGVLLTSPACRRLVTAVSKEVAAAFDEDAERLEQATLNVMQATAGNWSSMASDIRDGRGTEIEYLNAHVVRVAKGRGLSAPVCETLVEMIKASGEVKTVGAGEWS